MWTVVFTILYLSFFEKSTFSDRLFDRENLIQGSSRKFFELWRFRGGVKALSFD